VLGPSSLLYRTRKLRQAGKMHRVSHAHRLSKGASSAGRTMTEPQDSHSLSEREDPSMLWRLHLATSFGQSSRMGRLNSNHTYMLSTLPSTLSTSTRRHSHKRPRDKTRRLANQVLELNSLASRPAQRNIKIRIETTQVAVRDKE